MKSRIINPYQQRKSILKTNSPVQVINNRSINIFPEQIQGKRYELVQGIGGYY